LDANEEVGDGMADLEYLSLGRGQRRLQDLRRWLISLPKRMGQGALRFVRGLAGLIKKLGLDIADIGQTFVKGDWKTRVSFFIMGFGSFARGQFFRGLLFFLFQAVFFLYILFFGGAYLAKMGTLGTVETSRQGRVTVYGDNSFLILLYGILTLFFILAFLYTWRLNIRQNKISQQILASGKKLKYARDDIAALADNQFHKTLLSLPMLGLFTFTIVPIIFMILVAFTNYDYTHQPPGKLFTWVGLSNFRTMLSAGSANYGDTFAQVLFWTLTWAFFATFLNYFLGMLVAIMINKKGIRLKKMWRTILVMTIAIPQFVSLLYVSRMFAADGLINSYLISWGWISKPLPFWTDGTWARITIIIINIWIGIPYMMLIATGILMNIPADLYESARIDGANALQTYARITLPYMLFVTGPYLLTSFIGNLNNFNVIYLLTGGSPLSLQLRGNAGYTDLLITWLYKMTVTDSDYKMAAVIGIIVFIITAVISLTVYNMIPSVRHEEDFQ